MPSVPYCTDHLLRWNTDLIGKILTDISNEKIFDRPLAIVGHGPCALQLSTYNLGQQAP